MSTPNNYRPAPNYHEIRADGTERRALFSSHALQRVKERLPETHSMRKLNYAQLADVIELAVIGAIDEGRARKIVSPKHGSQFHVNVQKWVGYPLIVVVKTTGNDGQELGQDRMIAVTALVATDNYRKVVSRHSPSL